MKKILLIHGWNYTNYTTTKCTDAWANRTSFVSSLQQHFDVVKINLPGFCGTPDPQRPWLLDDFVSYVDKVINQEKPDVILGYSFGGAIALHWKYRTDNKNVETILVSPAIIRQYAETSPTTAQHFFKRILPKKAVAWLRYWYLAVVKKNPYYTTATPVMRDTYRNIVTIDLRNELKALQQPITLIYGEKDTATPPLLVQDIIKEANVKHTLEIIPEGSHDIANSHTKQLISLILKKGGPIEN